MFNFLNEQNKKNETVYAICFLFVFDLFQTLSKWINDNFITLDYIKKNLAVCPPYFQDCLRFYFLDNTPINYSQNIFYAFLGAFLFSALFFLYKKNFAYFFYLSLFVLIYKIVYLFFLTYLVPGNYNSFGIYLGLILLFSTYKVFYLRILFISFYLCAAMVKIHDGYMTGDVFSSLSLGVPLLPNYFLPYIGILFFFLCVLPPIMLINENKNIRLFALASLTLFHVYSITMIEFRYPILIIPILWLLFYFDKTDLVLSKHSIQKYLKDYFSIFIIFLMFALQLFPFFIKGDHKLTGEGYKYGYYMYEANHKCVSKKSIYTKDNKVIQSETESNRVFSSCDPYEEWFKIKRMCNPEKVLKINWSYEHSLNGGKYKKIINVENACILEYKLFSHNEWINTEGEYTDREVIKNTID